MNTQFITTTQLREQSTKVVANLAAGEDVTLVHRSKIIGVIKPIISFSKSIENIEDFRKALSVLKPVNIISHEKRGKIYRKYLKNRYGKSIS